jgi:hypothetical protein
MATVPLCVSTLSGKEATVEVPSDTSVWEAKKMAAEQLGSSPKVQRWVLGTRALRNDEVIEELLSEAEVSGAVTRREEVLQLKVLCVILPSFALAVKVIRFTPSAPAETEMDVEISATADTPVQIVKKEAAEAASIQAGSKLRFMKNGHPLSDRCRQTLGQNGVDSDATLHLIYSPMQEAASEPPAAVESDVAGQLSMYPLYLLLLTPGEERIMRRHLNFGDVENPAHVAGLLAAADPAHVPGLLPAADAERRTPELKTFELKPPSERKTPELKTFELKPSEGKSSRGFRTRSVAAAATPCERQDVVAAFPRREQLPRSTSSSCHQAPRATKATAAAARRMSRACSRSRPGGIDRWCSAAVGH